MLVSDPTPPQPLTPPLTPEPLNPGAQTHTPSPLPLTPQRQHTLTRAKAVSSASGSTRLPRTTLVRLVVGKKTLPSADVIPVLVRARMRALRVEDLGLRAEG